MKIYKKATEDKPKVRYTMVSSKKALDEKKRKAKDEEPMMTLTEGEVSKLRDFLNGDTEIEIIEDPLNALTEDEIIILKELIPLLQEQYNVESGDGVDEADEDEDEDLELDEEVDPDEFAEDDATTKATEEDVEEEVEDKPEEKAEDIAKENKARVWVKKTAVKAGDQKKRRNPNAEMFKTQVKATDSKVEEEVKFFNFHK